ncbi:unnamed protein product [Trichobilharzia szidati]|nr:unnamed protein product [Trichobilharzia szidati]
MFNIVINSSRKCMESLYRTRFLKTLTNSNVISYRTQIGFSSVADKAEYSTFSSASNQLLKDTDPEMWELINAEKQRQMSYLELVASENFTSRAVLECNGSCLTNKYAEGYPNQRLPKGVSVIDKIEQLTQKRLLELFKLKPTNKSLYEADWGVNVQAFSGSPANMAVYTALLKPNDRIMGLRYIDGGHTTHGYFNKHKNLSAASIFFNTIPYSLNPETEYIDYDMLERDAKLINPKLMIAGICTYPRLLDYEKFRKICDSVGAILLADMAHISGLVAAETLPSPFMHADVVTSTTHKTLRGPRSGVIFYRRKPRSTEQHQCVYQTIPVEEYERRINEAVFPGLQSGPHANTIAGVASMAKEAATADFQRYAQQVLSNSQTLAQCLLSKGIALVTGGTDIHFVVVDLSKSPSQRGLGRGDASLVQIIADMVGISLSSVCVPSDESNSRRSGLRIGTPALTSRGFLNKDFENVANLIEEVLKLTSDAKKVTDDIQKFSLAVKGSPNLRFRIQQLRQSVSDFALSFPMPGHCDI